MRQFIKAMLIRAIKTFAQAFVSLVLVGSAINENDWLNIISVSAVAFIMSCATSIATGLPEAPFEGDSNK